MKRRNRIAKKNTARRSQRSRKSKSLLPEYSILEPRQLLAAMPIINEFMASNNNALLDGNGNASDWIEIYNAGDQSVNLANWSLTDDATNLNKWVFPSTNLNVGQYLVVFASGTGTPDLTGKLHTNFSLSAAGEYVGLVNPSQTVVSSFGSNGTNYPEQFTDISYGYLSVGGQPDQNAPRYFSGPIAAVPPSPTAPTPGVVNKTTGFTGLVKDTNFSVKRGYFTTAFNVNVTSSTLGSTIVYTTNGSDPSLTNGTQVTAGQTSTPTATVPVSTTTTLRARAFKTGLLETNTDTQTYLFLASVVQQPNNPAGYTSNWSGTPADYEMDPQVVNNGAYTADLLAGLRELPALSLTSSISNLFGSSGIYTNPTNDNLEIPISAEYILQDGSTGFQIDAGLKIAGGASRNPTNTPKHSMSIRFRSEYGSSKLNYNLFEDTTVNSFNSIQLRAMYNNSWTHRDGGQRDRALMIRDEFIRDSMIAMGQDDGGAGNYAHLYLNGLYWGVYNVHERADASHYAAYNGGNSEDYDALNGGTAIDGNTNSFNSLKSVVAGGNWTAIQQVLDVDNFIDWMIGQEYGGNVDLKTDGNWRAAGGGTANAKWKIYAWDSERVLEGTTAGTPGSLTDATGMYNNLVNVPEFRVRFGDRVQKHYFNNGAMTPTNVATRFNARVTQLQNAIVGESARWGDYRRDVRPSGSSDLYTRNDHWTPEVNRLNSSYFTSRSNFVVNRYKSMNPSLLSSVVVPVFSIGGTNQHGGLITGGSSLTMSGAGQIYFTVNGTDPRAVGGAAVGTLYTGPTTLLATTQVQARSLSGGNWSALSSALFTVSDQSIVVSEINYHPYDPTTSELAAIPTVVKDDFEFVEIVNRHPTQSINVLGYQLTNAVIYTFDNAIRSTVLAPGQRALVVENLAAFQLRYGTGLNVIGEWSGGLSNSGENLKLLDNLGSEILSVNYTDVDPWSVSADGFGATLVMADPNATPANELGKYYRWRGSLEYGGTPGAASAAKTGVVINEILAHTDAPLSDSIELFNPTGAAVNIGGWYLSDSGNNPFKFQIPGGTVLGSGQYIVFNESDFNPTPGAPLANHFGLNGASGDEVFLTRAIGGSTIAFEDAVNFSGTFNGESLGRIPNGSGRLNRLASRSFGTANGIAKVGPLVISEVNYNPAAPTQAALNQFPTLTSTDLEFIEIHNPTSGPINTTNWQIRGEVSFNFPAMSIGSRQTWVIISFNPANAANANRLQAFKINYGIQNNSSIQILGGYSGNLSNNFGKISLLQPDAPTQTTPPVIPEVVVDEVLYDDLAPWANADGSGNSLNRHGFAVNGNLAPNWTAVAPSPGSLTAAVPKLVSTVRDAGNISRPDLWNTLVVKFDNDVVLGASALTLRNDTSGGTSVPLTGIGFSYNNVTFTATWDFSTLSQRLNAAFYTYTLNAASISSFNSGHLFDGDNNNSPGGNFSAAQYVAIPGDANLDGDVDVSELLFPLNVGDLTIVKASLGVTTGATWSSGDFNGDGDVDVSQLDLSTLQNVGDLTILYANLGRNVKPPANLSFVTTSGGGSETELSEDAVQDSDVVGESLVTPIGNDPEWVRVLVTEPVIPVPSMVVTDHSDVELNNPAVPAVPTVLELIEPIVAELPETLTANFVDPDANDLLKAEESIASSPQSVLHSTEAIGYACAWAWCPISDFGDNLERAAVHSTVAQVPSDLMETLSISSQADTSIIVKPSESDDHVVPATTRPTLAVVKPRSESVAPIIAASMSATVRQLPTEARSKRIVKPVRVLPDFARLNSEKQSPVRREQAQILVSKLTLASEIKSVNKVLDKSFADLDQRDQSKPRSGASGVEEVGTELDAVFAQTDWLAN